MHPHHRHSLPQLCCSYVRTVVTPALICQYCLPRSKIRSHQEGSPKRLVSSGYIGLEYTIGHRSRDDEIVRIHYFAIKHRSIPLSIFSYQRFNCTCDLWKISRALSSSFFIDVMHVLYEYTLLFVKILRILPNVSIDISSIIIGDACIQKAT